MTLKEIKKALYEFLMLDNSWIVVGYVLLGLLVVYFIFEVLPYKRLKCKVIKKKSEGQPETFYYSSMKWKKKKQTGWFFNNERHRWQFLTSRQRVDARSAIDKKEIPVIRL